MKVKELIENLGEYNPEAEVVFATEDGDMELLSIYSGDLDKNRLLYCREEPKTDPHLCLDLERK
jgi:hypothetical protein